jgi:hypothetical protein
MAVVIGLVYNSSCKKYFMCCYYIQSKQSVRRICRNSYYTTFKFVYVAGTKISDRKTYGTSSPWIWSLLIGYVRLFCLATSVTENGIADLTLS